MKKKKTIIIMLLQILFLYTACNNVSKNEPVCVLINKHVEKNILTLCISIKNNTGKNIYLHPGSYFLNIKKEQNGVLSDAIVDFYNAIPNINDEITDGFRKNPQGENNKICGEINNGPIDNKYFRLKVAKALLNHISEKYRLYAIDNHYEKLSLGLDSEFNDKNNLDNMICQDIFFNMSCLFIPSEGEIRMSQSYDLSQIQFERLFLHFEYPNNNKNTYYLKKGSDKNTKHIIDSCVINYPKNLLGYELYSDSIKSDVIEIQKPN
jgi:hypothetical protein